jgi:hypothetical protein
MIAEIPILVGGSVPAAPIAGKDFAIAAPD